MVFPRATSRFANRHSRYAAQVCRWTRTPCPLTRTRIIGDGLTAGLYGGGERTLTLSLHHRNFGYRCRTVQPLQRVVCWPSWRT